MRVILINDFAYVNGGASQIALATAKVLAKNGIDTCLFAGTGPIDVTLHSVANLQVICLNEVDILNDSNRLRAMMKGLWNFRAGRYFKRLLAGYDNRDTIIHVHTCQKVLSASCIYVAKKMGFKVIYHLHDFGIACPNLGFYDYKKSSICKRQAMSFSCVSTNCDSRKYAHKIWRIARQLIQNKIGGMPSEIDGFIAVSKFSEKILQHYLPTGKEIRVIKNPVEQAGRSLNVDVTASKYLLFIGRLSPEKNPVLAARCAKELNMPIIFVGTGVCEAEIKKENPEAILAGWVDKKDMPRYIKKARALILSSAWYETQGLVVQETAAYGVPAIVPDTCAATDYIEDGINGLIFESNNKESLKEKITLSLENSFWRNVSDNSLEYYMKETISMEQYVDMILTLYNKLLKWGFSK